MYICFHTNVLTIDYNLGCAQNVLDLGGATADQVRSLLASIFSLEEKGRKHKISEDQFPGRTPILDILDEIEKVIPNDANNLVLRPMEHTEAVADESGQTFLEDDGNASESS